MNEAARLEALEDALIFLRRVAEHCGVVVEGPRDADALQALGVGGTIRKVNEPGSTQVLVDSLANDAARHHWRKVVILTDWDRTGARLASRLQGGLVGQTTVDMEARRRLQAACHCKCVEHIPSELQALRDSVRPKG